MADNQTGDALSRFVNRWVGRAAWAIAVLLIPVTIFYVFELQIFSGLRGDRPVDASHVAGAAVGMAVQEGFFFLLFREVL